jgi:predicted acetyltransferase
MTQHAETTVEIGRPDRSQIEQLLDLWRVAFNPPPEWRAARDPDSIKPEELLVATREGRVLASARWLGLDQWYGGRPVRTAGVAGVATDPLHRGLGLGSKVVAALLRQQREAGNDLATLYPATVPVYRRLGFEYAGVQTRYQVPIAALPTAGPDAPQLAPLGEDDQPIRTAFRRLAATENGLAEGLDDDWWQNRVLGRHHPDGPATTIVVSGEEPEGYASFRQESLRPDWGFRVACNHLVANSRPALQSLLGYFRRFRGLGEDLTFYGPPAEPLAMVLEEQTISATWSFRNMSRILDVAGALEARGYPVDVRGEATLAVEDGLFEDNAGTFGIEAGDGKVRVSRIDPLDGHGAQPAIGIGALTALFTGYMSAPAAARVGLVDPDTPGLELLGRLFAGPAPWMPDFF